MQIIVNSLMANYLVAGQPGATILMLHGWNSNQEVFRPLASNLAKNNRIISLDLPGMGKSQAPAATWDLDTYTNFIVAFLTKLKIERVDIIIGHSNGGALAIKLASNQDVAAKLKFKKVILMSSSGVRTKQKLKKLAFKFSAKVGRLSLSVLPISEIKKRSLKKKLYGVAGSEALDNPALEETFRLVVSEDITAQASKLKLPTLLIYGRDDQDTPPEYGQILADSIKSSKLEVINGAGHYVFLDKPEQVLSSIKEFLDVG